MEVPALQRARADRRIDPVVAIDELSQIAFWPLRNPASAQRECRQGLAALHQPLQQPSRRVGVVLRHELGNGAKAFPGLGRPVDRHLRRVRRKPRLFRFNPARSGDEQPSGEESGGRHARFRLGAPEATRPMWAASAVTRP
ncbi:MAG TPA: hypothetical protein VFI16_07185 [Anaeromyxobacteraceae bacterium]|nr:hypothetical protein [Anaeromyxobacteraceae bacterium]